MKKGWTIRGVDDKFNKGDLVLVKQYSYYDLSNPFGCDTDKFGDILSSDEAIEELLSKESVCLGIITSKDIISWEPEAEAWMMATVDEPYVLVQFRVHCFGINSTIKTRLVDSTAIRLLSKGDIGRRIEESLENLKNNKQ
jgi:hypothetical protein